MSYSYSISSKKSSYEKTYGINSNVKTTGGNNVNARLGLTTKREDNGPAQSVKATLDTGAIKYSTKNKNTSIGISAPKVSVGGSVVVGGGAGVSAKAALVEVNGSKKIKVGGAEVKLSGEVGVGVAAGIKGEYSSNTVKLGGKANVLPGVYVGANIDISF